MRRGDCALMTEAVIASEAKQSSADRDAPQSLNGTVAMKQPAVYIMTSQRNGTLYVGVTSDLPRRVYQHREGLVPGFTTRYACKQLVWYELHDSMAGAITREKQIKAGSRKMKLALIEAMNPRWCDLYGGLM